MSHPAQRDFLRRVREEHYTKFRGKRVLDCGSLDINGSNRDFFQDCEYIGIDVGPGDGVDIVCPAYEYKDAIGFDVVVSTEMLEHSISWAYDLDNMMKLLRPGGLLLITCGGDGRAEHGTERTRPQDSPYTTSYYRNLSNEMFSAHVSPRHFTEYFLRQHKRDLQFYGIKRWDMQADLVAACM